MSAIILPRRWERQPTEYLDVDWTNPITRKLAACVNYGVFPANAVSRMPLSIISGSPELKSGASWHDANENWRVAGIGATYDVSALAVVSSSAALPGNHKMIASSLTNNLYLSLYDDKPFLRLAGNLFGTSTPPQNRQYTIGFTYRYNVSGGKKLWYNGNVEATDSGTGVWSAHDISIGAHSDNTLGWRGGINLVLWWNRGLSDAEYFEVSRNPWQLFKPRREILYFTTATTDPRYARPNSDITAGAWTPSTGSDLYAMVDETSASDTDYISTTSASTCTLGLNPVTDPGTSANQVLTVRCKSPYGNDLIATLKQSTTTIATRTFSDLGTDWENKQIALTSGECDAITDYSALRVDLEAQA